MACAHVVACLLRAYSPHNHIQKAVGNTRRPMEPIYDALLARL